MGRSSWGGSAWDLKRPKLVPATICIFLSPPGSYVPHNLVKEGQDEGVTPKGLEVQFFEHITHPTCAVQFSSRSLTGSVALWMPSGPAH